MNWLLNTWVVNVQYADQGLHLCSALLPVAQSLAPAHPSPVPDIRAPRNPRMREMLFGESNLKHWMTGRIAFAICIHLVSAWIPKLTSAFQLSVNGVRSVMLRSPAVRRSPPKRRTIPSRRHRRISTTFTFPTTTRLIRIAPTPAPKLNSSSPTGRTPQPVAPAGSALLSWLMYRARAPRAVPAAPERSVSANC